jgi:two-component system, cell cycle sensor histidine kinase and response regulator CckA
MLAMGLVPSVSRRSRLCPGRPEDTEMRLRVLIVEDSEDDSALLLRELRRGGYEVSYQRVDTAATMTSALDNQEWDLVISDHSMPHFSGIEALHLLRTKGIDVPLIFVSGTLGEEMAVTALKGGAQDYLMKNNLTRLVTAVQRELREAEERRERKKLEQQLRQAQKMEAVGRLAGGIAHDFNNLLGVIIGYSELLEERLGQNDPLRPKAEQIKKAGQRAASLTRQLLAFSRQQMFEPKVLDLNAVVADALNMLQRLIGEDIELVTVPAPELGRIKADQGQIEQIIMNLAVNARDAMPEGGKLTITTVNAELDEVYARQHPVVPGSYVMLAVSDTGCGMDQETQAHIFEPFFTTKEKGKGTGLGLATVYGVVKQSGGYIWVYSEPGLGSTFKIYLPRIEDTVTASDPGKGGQETARGWETVLLVEDEQSLRELAHELLEDDGYTVLEAANGADAIRVAEQHQGPIHLLMTDVVMPGIDGRKLAGRMTRSYPELKVLYMSGYTDDAIVHHGVLDPGIALLQKPFTRATLTRKLREALGDAEEHAIARPGARMDKHRT